MEFTIELHPNRDKFEAMPREETIINEAMSREKTIINRLGDIPVLNDSWTSAWNYYARIKDFNSLTKLTLDTAECSVKTAAKFSAPIISRCQPQSKFMIHFLMEINFMGLHSLVIHFSSINISS